MSKLVLESNPNQIMEKLFDFILKEDLVTNFDLGKIKMKANDFYEEFYADFNMDDKKKLVEEIEKFSLYDLSNYDSADIKIVSKLIMTLSVFKSEFVRLLTLGSGNKRYMDFGGLSRKVSPPVEAYEYMGNNKLDINPTHRSYGLLFE